MPLLSNNTLDALLNYVDTNAVTIHYCSSEPTTFAGVSAVSLANAPCAVTVPGAGTPNGRQVTCTPATGTGTAAGTATHWALVGGSSELLATNSLNASIGITVSASITSSTFTIVAAQAVAQ